MTKDLQYHIEEIQALFAQYKMRRVWVFGSVLDLNRFNPSSDVDFLYEPNKSEMSTREFLDNPQIVKNQLEEILGRKVDFIRNLPFRNPFFKAESFAQIFGSEDIRNILLEGLRKAGLD